MYYNDYGRSNSSTYDNEFRNYEDSITRAHNSKTRNLGREGDKVEFIPSAFPRSVIKKASKVGDGSYYEYHATVGKGDDKGAYVVFNLPYELHNLKNKVIKGTIRFFKSYYVGDGDVRTMEAWLTKTTAVDVDEADREDTMEGKAVEAKVSKGYSAAWKKGQGKKELLFNDEEPEAHLKYSVLVDEDDDLVEMYDNDEIHTISGVIAYQKDRYTYVLEPDSVEVID